jgi:hypothetical protein
MHSSIRQNPGQLDAAGAGLPPVLLDARVVQPGDVLLTYGNSVTSKGIFIATRGPFSHAEVWMPAIGPDDVMLAEADGLGVSFTPMMPIRLERPATCALASAYAVNGAPRRYKLLRHPDSGTLPPERLLAASRAEQNTLVRRKLARERKALLGAWRQRRAERAAATRTLRGLLQTPTLDEAAIGHVERTLDLATQAARVVAGRVPVRRPVARGRQRRRLANT